MQKEFFSISKKFYNNPAIFIKVYNILTNAALLGDCPLNFYNFVVELSLKRVKDGYSQMFLVCYINFLDQAIKLQENLRQILKNNKAKVLESMKYVP